MFLYHYHIHFTLTLLDAHISLTLDLKLKGVTWAEGHAISRSLSDRMNQTLSKQGGDIGEFSLQIYINIHYHKCIIYLPIILFNFDGKSTESGCPSSSCPLFTVTNVGLV